MNMIRKKHDIVFLFLNIIFMLGISAEVVTAENIDPDNNDSQYAYGENVGWLNFEPGGNSGDGAEVTSSKVTGYAWGENIGWINLSPATGGGVVNDGAGNLSGYAWGENVGWINFKPPGGGVTIDVNGDFNGRAWGENIGWIHFKNTNIPYKVQTSWKGIIPPPTPVPIPEIINDLVTFDPIKSTYNTTSDTTGCPPGFGGKFSFYAKLTNKGNSPSVTNLVVQVKKLTNHNLLHNADGGHGGEGSIMTIPLTEAYADGILSHGEFVNVHFIICLKKENKEKSFTFLVDVLGVEKGVSSAAPRLTNAESRRVKFKKGFFGRFRPRIPRD